MGMAIGIVIIAFLGLIFCLMNGSKRERIRKDPNFYFSHRSSYTHADVYVNSRTGEEVKISRNWD